MTSFKLGIDVSHWQGVMRWPMAWAAGARFAILRAGSVDSAGYHYTDYQWENNIAAAPDYMSCGTYWYFRVEKPAIDQADFYSNLIGQYHQSRRLLLRPACDIEQTGGYGPGFVAWAVSTFVNRVHDNLGIWPMIYTRSSFWNPYVGDLPLWDTLDLKIARYKALVHPWSDGLYKPRDWNLPVAVGQPACWFWQYSADGNYKGAEFGADSPHIDLDYFLGDPGWFDGYVDFVSPPPEPVVGPVPVEEKPMIKVITPIYSIPSATVGTNRIWSDKVPDEEIWRVQWVNLYSDSLVTSSWLAIDLGDNLPIPLTLGGVPVSGNKPVFSNLTLTPGMRIAAYFRGVSEGTVLSFRFHAEVIGQ